MTECVCEAVLLGRESVQGTANADSLASLVRLVSRRGGGTGGGGGGAATGRRCRLRCSRDGIEIRPVRRLEDEGFESDDDAVSQASSDSNSSSYCFVEDHVLKYPPGTPPPAITADPAGSVGTDSANSSGASDNDDADNSLTPRPPAVDAARPLKPKRPSDDCPPREAHAFNDVAFCHTDPAFPKVLVLVIKKKSKTKRDEVESVTGLEAVIFQCKSVENLRDVCASYKEFSRRLKMDLQFRYPHRRKDSPVDNSPGTLYRNVFNDLQRSASPGTPTNSPFFKTWMTHVSTKPHTFTKEPESLHSVESNKYNLVQRTDDDGVTHIEVSKAVDGESVAHTTTVHPPADEYSGSSSIISISTPDVGNLFVASSAPHVHADPREIDGVICADIDSSLLDAPYQASKVVDDADKTRSPPNVRQTSTVGTIENPPQRPQRGKYVKKTATKQKDVEQSSAKSKTGTRDSAHAKGPPPEPPKQPGTHEKVVRGQFIRVTVEPQVQSVRTGHRLFSGERESKSPTRVSYPVWSLPSQGQRSRRAREDETDYRTAAGRDPRSKSYQRRSRSSGSGRRGSSPPARPVAYRYIEPAPQPRPLSNRFFGKLKEIASINNAYVGTLSRRRNSSGDLSTAQFYQYLEPALSSAKSSTNLKSVIKKKNCNDNMEPKKVTFSAYATVQVVD